MGRRMLRIRAWLRSSCGTEVDYLVYHPGSDSDVMDERLAPVFMGGSDGFTEAKSSTAAGDIKW